jgi:VacB/RNase II family 3'-5' exoribonuclease
MVCRPAANVNSGVTPVHHIGRERAECHNLFIVAPLPDFPYIVFCSFPFHLPTGSMAPNMPQQRSILETIARRVMTERGLLTDFSSDAVNQLNAISTKTGHYDGNVKDLRSLLWCSIDNDDSKDLDQLSVAMPSSSQNTRILVAVADVDALVPQRTPIDLHAQQNTTSVYTPAVIFPMLPERLSTDLTSLNFEADRPSIVFEMTVDTAGNLQSSDVYLALVRNKAKLAYNSVAAWLEQDAPMPEQIGAVPGLAENIRLQFKLARAMRTVRHQHGALDLKTVQSRTVFDGDAIRDLVTEDQNGAKDLIEDFMIAANGVSARFLTGKKYPSLRRVVRTPKRWERIVEVAREHGTKLPSEPDAKALNDFLLSSRTADPLRFPDLSLSVIKLLGPGEYIVEDPGNEAIGHFGLAVRDYSHSTAPNRRFPDLITHRLLKAAFGGAPAPYTRGELDLLARHCTQQEDAAKKVERQVEKSSAALLLQSRIGEEFDALVTGAADKGTWVRLLTLPVEGRLENPSPGTDVGHRLRVKLVNADVEKGFLDFRAKP